ncbi:MAG: hypothetical protein ACR5K9_03575 [Wolbachia sp.]
MSSTGRRGAGMTGEGVLERHLLNCFSNKYLRNLPDEKKKGKRSPNGEF